MPSRAERMAAIYTAIHDCSVSQHCRHAVPNETPKVWLDDFAVGGLAILAQAPSRGGVRVSGVHWVANTDTWALRQSGQHLDGFLRSCGYTVGRPTRELARPYTSNVAQCWFGSVRDARGNTSDRAPAKAALSACARFWLGELSAVRPRVVVALGKSAAESIMGAQKAGLLGGEAPRLWQPTPLILDGQAITCVMLYHPAYLLRPFGRKFEPDYRRAFSLIGNLLSS